MSISFNSNIFTGSPYKSKFALALIHSTAALKSILAPQKRNMDIQMATAKDSAEALNGEWQSHRVLQFYIIICPPLSSKEKNPSWKHFSPGASGRSGPWLKSMSSAGTFAHAGPAQSLLFLLWPGRANKLPSAGNFPFKVQENQEPAWTEVISTASLTPCCCIEAWGLFPLLPKTASPAHGDFTTQVPGGVKGWSVFWVQDSFSAGQPCLCLEKTKLLEGQVSAWALLQKVLLHLWLSSPRMDFQAEAFIPPLPSSHLCLKEFSPLASFLFASMQALDAQGLFWSKIPIQGTLLGGILAGKSKG